MNFIHHESGERRIAELTSFPEGIKETQDLLDIFANAGTGYIIIPGELLDPSFFDLKSRFAGELLQKVSNYRVRLAVTGDFSGYGSESLKAFIRESNRTGQVLFLDTAEEAVNRFSV